MTTKKLEKNGLNGMSNKPVSLLDQMTADVWEQVSEAVFEEEIVDDPNRLEIICDGDSWVFGCEIVDPELKEQYDDDVYVGYFDFEEANDAYRRPRIFSHHLSKILDCKVTNLSWPADDNGTILRRTIEYITSEYLAKGRSTDNLFVMVGWSSPERNSFWYKDDKLSSAFRLWPQVAHFDAPAQEKFWELYVTYLWNAEEYMPRYVFNVIQLQNFCKAHNIKWMCWNSFYQTPAKSPNEWYDLDIREELEKLTNFVGGYQYQTTDQPNRRHGTMNNYVNLWDTVDPVRFYKKDQPCSTFKSYIEQPELGIENVLCGWHPGPESHEAWAHELVRYIKEHNLLS
jgi:hypothetical protein